MYPYVLMLAVPSGLALIAPQRRGVALLLAALLYFMMIAFRFQVGMDWNNYLDIYLSKRHSPLLRLIYDREPGYGLLTWIAAELGAGLIFLNAVSALVFCWGFFAVARRCREPWVAIAVATPLLVIAFAMTSVRQAIAAGIIFYAMAHWERHRTFARILFVLFASLFHFSAIFVMIFVALGSRAPTTVRVMAAVLIGVLIIAIVQFAPESVEGYSRLYLGSGGKFTAPGAIIQIGVVAVAALIYFINRRAWVLVNGEDPLYRDIAWVSLLFLGAIPFSSVGAYRFALYFWPMAMVVYGGIPAIIPSGVGRLLYRIAIVAASFAMMIGWLVLANNSPAWLPYQNWLLLPDGATKLRRPRIV